MTAGEWLTMAERVDGLADEFQGTALEHWDFSLRCLAGDCRREAGAVAVHEIRGDRRAA